MARAAASLGRFKPSHDDFSYERYPFYWIARVGSSYAATMEKALKPLGLTTTGWRLSLILRERGTQSVSEISKHSAVKLTTVTKTVYAMQRRGLVAVSPRKSDARVTEVSMTAKGRKLIDTVVEETAGQLDRALEGFKRAEIVELNALLSRLLDNLETA